MLIVSLLLAVLALAWANGANDKLKATATAYGSAAIDYARARQLATAAQLSGSLASIVLAPAQLSWSALGGSYFLPLLLTPFMAAAAAGVV